MLFKTTDLYLLIVSEVCIYPLQLDNRNCKTYKVDSLPKLPSKCKYKLQNTSAVTPACKYKWPQLNQRYCQFLFSRRRSWVFISLFSNYSVLSQVPQKQSLRQGLL